MAKFEGGLQHNYTIFRANIRWQTDSFSKYGLKDVQLTEMAEAEAIISDTGQIQQEMVSIRRNYRVLLTSGDFYVKRKGKVLPCSNCMSYL